MIDPLEALSDAAIGEWADPVDATRQAVHALLALADGDWERRGVDATQTLRTKRADSPLLLAATEVALEPNPLRAADGLADILIRLDDTSWTAELGLAVARHDTIGVLSLGTTTVRVLEAVIELGGGRPELLCERRSVARGLGMLGVPTVIAHPSRAECLLLPVAARHKERVWTTSRNAVLATEARDAGRTVVTVCHPLANLSPLNRLAYRPAAYLIDLLL